MCPIAKLINTPQGIPFHFHPGDWEHGIPLTLLILGSLIKASELKIAWGKPIRWLTSRLVAPGPSGVSVRAGRFFTGAHFTVSSAESIRYLSPARQFRVDCDLLTVPICLLNPYSQLSALLVVISLCKNSTIDIISSVASNRSYTLSDESTYLIALCELSSL